MKRVIAIVTMTAIFTAIISGCLPFGKKDPISFDYKLSETSVDYFTLNDTAEMLDCGNPLYAGAQPLPFEGAKGYEQARAEKVAYIMEQADALVKSVNETETDFDKLRSSLLKYLDVVLLEEVNSGVYVRDAFLKVSKFKTARAVANASYISVRSSNPANSFAKAYFDYQAAVRAIEYANMALKDADWIFRYAAITMQQLEGRNNQKLLDAAKTLDADMSDTAVQTKLAKVFDDREKIGYAFKQLESADYYFANASSSFIKENLPKLREKAATIKPANESDTGPEFINEYLDYFEAVNNEGQASMDGMDKKFIIEVADAGSKSTASAMNGDGFNWYEKSEKVLKTEPKADPPSEGYLSKGFGYVKSACQALKTGIGVGVDVVGVAVNNVNSVGLGLYYGGLNQQSINDINEHIVQGYQQVVTNYQNNMSGVQTFKTATEYFTAAENTGGDAAEAAVEKTVGKGYTSWFAGGIGKLTVGMFTGLGKGISMVANKQATAGETAEGALNIGFSFIGGSKALINGKNTLTALKTTGEAGAKLAKDGILYTGEKLFAADAAKLTKETAAILLKKNLNKADVYKLISNSLSMEANQLVRAEIKANRGKLAEEFAKILKSGGTAALEEAKMNIKMELIEKLGFTFEKNISGLMSAIKVNLGSDLAGFADNLVGGWIDNGLGTIINSYINQIAGTVTIDDIVGTYNGAIVITDVYVAPELLEKSTKKDNGETELPGCDISFEALKDLVGKSIPQVFKIAKTGDYAGTMSVVSNGESSDPMDFTFSDGAFTCQGTKDGSTTTLTLTATRIDNKIMLTGNAVIKVMGESIKITGDVSAEK